MLFVTGPDSASAVVCGSLALTSRYFALSDAQVQAVLSRPLRRKPLTDSGMHACTYAESLGSICKVDRLQRKDRMTDKSRSSSHTGEYV